jgi:hypothetical protein
MEGVFEEVGQRRNRMNQVVETFEHRDREFGLDFWPVFCRWMTQGLQSFKEVTQEAEEWPCGGWRIHWRQGREGLAGTCQQVMLGVVSDKANLTDKDKVGEVKGGMGGWRDGQMHRRVSL